MAALLSRQECGVAIVCSGGEEQAASLQDVVGESEHTQHGMDLGAAAQRELGEAPLPESRIDAFAHAAPLVDRFAVRALHAPAPGGDAATVVVARRIGVALVLAARGRAIHLDARAGGPFDIVILVESAVDEVTLGSAAVALFERIEHWTQQTAVRAGGRHIDTDHDLTLGDGAELAIVGRSIAAIGHLHDARLWG